MSEKSEALRLVAENERLAAEVANRNRRALAGDEAVAALANVHAHYEGLEAQRDALLVALDQCLNGTLIGGHTHNDNGLEVLAERCGAPHIANELRRLANIARAAIKAVEEGK